MAGKRRIRLALHRDEVLRAHRVFAKHNKLVYVLIADKRQRYGKLKSRIVYIGTTKNGGVRVAGSVACRASDIFTHCKAVYSFHARVVTCKPRQKVKTWRKLERALLLKFKERFGTPPLLNVHGKHMRETDEFAYFHPAGVAGVIDELS